MCVLCALIGLGTASARASERETVLFQINQTTVFGQSVFVLGDLPELGGNDLRFAVKLEPSQYPVWKASVSLPKGTAYSFRYYIRNDAAGQWGNTGNGTPVGAVQFAQTSPPSAPNAGKTVWWMSSINGPVIHWREPGGSFQSIVMHDTGPGRTGAERRWAARGFGVDGRTTEFYFTDAQGGQRTPASGSFSTALDRQLVQDGRVFTYEPAPTVGQPVKRYTPASPPTIVSAALGGETRRYRVITPRGYDDHPERSYPVLYLHDGQNVFEQGAFGTWNADESAQALIDAGVMREVIMVGADHGANRIPDYSAPDAGGNADDYASFLVTELKPLIDANYRTMPGAAETGTLGSSMGGQVSMYLGWDFTGTFTRIGAFSGAWTVYTNGFYNRVQAQPKRDLRLYIDSGDSGTASDNFWVTVGLRDNLINPARAAGVGGAFVQHLNLLHTYGPGHIHNEPAWAARLPGCLAFLYPATEDQVGLDGVPSSRPGDVNDDDLEDLEDLYAFEQWAPGPNSTLDVDRDGVLDSVADRATLRAIVRADG